MKLKLFIVGILLTIALNVFSQTTYSRILDSAHVYSAVCDANHNIYLAGQGVEYSNYSNGMLITCLTPNANIIWAKKFGISYTDYANAIVSKADTLFVAGTSYNPSLGYSSFCCIKMNLNGDTLWSRSIDFGPESVASSAYYCEDNGFLVTGWANSLGEIGVAKLTANGDLVWAKTYMNDDLSANPRSIKQLDNGNIVIVGDFSNFNGFSLTLDSNGNTGVAKQYSLTNAAALRFNDFIPNSNGMVLYFTALRTYLAQIDVEGNPVWAVGEDRGNFILPMDEERASPKLIKTNDNGYIFVNPGDWYYSPNSIAYKTDSIGHIEWATYLDMPLQGVFPMNDGGYLAYGNGPIIGVKSTKINEPQIGLVKIDSTGYSDSCSYPINFTESTIELVVSDVTITESYSGTLVFQHLEVTDVNLLKRSGCVDFIDGIGETNPIPYQLIASPNPTSGQFELSFSDNQNHKVSSLEVVNALGEVVYQSFNSFSSTLSIDLGHQASGIYLVKVFTNGNVYATKVLVTD